MTIKSIKQMRKLAELVDRGELSREVFNKLIDETDDITRLPDRATKKSKLSRKEK